MTNKNSLKYFNSIFDVFINIQILLQRTSLQYLASMFIKAVKYHVQVFYQENSFIPAHVQKSYKTFSKGSFDIMLLN